MYDSVYVKDMSDGFLRALNSMNESLNSLVYRVEALNLEVLDLKSKVDDLERENEAIKGELAALNPVDQELAGEKRGELTGVASWL